MSRIGLLASAVFVIVSFLLGRSGDGEILIAILAWPSSLVTALICDRAEALCDIRKVPFLLVVVFGSVQFYLLGHVLGRLFKPRIRD